MPEKDRRALSSSGSGTDDLGSMCRGLMCAFGEGTSRRKDLRNCGDEWG